MRKITLIIALLLTGQAFSTVVRFETTVGNIDIELYDDEAPITVANFLNYVNDGDYDGTVIHRIDPGFVIQGGGYRFAGNRRFDAIPTDPAITNEAQISNSVGTISMARTNDPNSATSQFFFNMANNTFLDPTNNDAGFTVFGEVIRGIESLYVMDSLLRINFFDSIPAGPFGEFPLYRYDEGTNPQQSNPIQTSNVIEINRAFELTETFQITEGMSGAWFNPDTSGQGVYFEVLPSAGVIVLAWFTFDSTDPDAGVPSAVGDASNRWLTASGSFQGNQFVGTVFKTSGGLFDDNQAASTTPIGSISISFNDCSTGLMSYVLDDSGLSNTINIQRVSGVNVDFCENLAIEQNPGVAVQ